MMCERCGKKEAEIYIKSTVNGQETELSLCRDCAEETGYLEGLRGFSPWKGLIPDELGLLSEWLRPGTAHTAAEKTCPGCGMTAAQLASGGRAGCAQCYESFAQILNPMIRRIHGGGAHQGTAPASADEAIHRRARISALREALAAAVKEENFEQAAGLRDEIRAVENGGAKHV